MIDLSPEFFRGLFDADGTMRIELVDRKKKAKKCLKKPFGCYISFQITQSENNKDVLETLQKNYGGSLGCRTRTYSVKDETLVRKRTETVYKSYLTSLSGQNFKQILLKNLPLQPTRLQDFILALKIDELLKQNVHATKKGQICIVALVYKTSNQLSNNTIIKRKNIEKWFTLIEPTPEEKEQGQKQADLFFTNFVNPIINQLLKSLPKTKLSENYIIGNHCGDGSFAVTISWDPKKQFINRPTWSITDSSETFLKAYLYTFKQGRIKKVGPRKGYAFQFVIENVKPCLETVIPFFDSYWLPPSKKVRFQKWKQACCMLKSHCLDTKNSFQVFLDLVYDMNINHKRLYSKELFMLWAEKRLQNRSRSIKRNSLLYKKLMGSDFVDHLIQL